MLWRSVQAGDAVLVKASNSIGLAQLVERNGGEPTHALPDRRATGLPRPPQPHPLHQLPRRCGERHRAADRPAARAGFIRWLRAKQGKGQPIRADGPQSHLAKRGTPTMGGLLILISVGDLGPAVDGPHNPYVWACLLVTAGFGLIGSSTIMTR